MTANDEAHLALGLADLSRFERGSASFVIGPDGAVCYCGTDATVQMRDGESIPAFWERLRRDHALTFGDSVTFLNNGGRLDTVRIKKRPRTT